MTDPLGEQAALVSAAELAADRVPSVRAIRAALHVGQPRAQRLREYLAAAPIRMVEAWRRGRRQRYRAGNRARRGCRL